MENVKEVAYDRYACAYTNNTVCPYCGEINMMDSEDSKSEDEIEIFECFHCDHPYAYRTNYTVTYTTAPLENHYREEKARLTKAREKYTREQGPQKHILATIASIDRGLQQLETLKRDYLDPVYPEEAVSEITSEEPQLPLHETYASMKAQLDTIGAKIQYLQMHCSHANMTEDNPCPDCGHEVRGWFCPNSPTKECEYYNEETDEWDEDSCIYCGEPEERK